MSKEELFEWGDEESPVLDTIQKQLLDWSNEPVPPPVKHDNPCINLYGKGPQDKTCGDCTHLIRDDYHNKSYPKCKIRKLTRGSGSDHKVRWPTCGRFEQRVEQDGDIFFEKEVGRTASFSVSIWKRGWWQYHQLWTLYDLANACERDDLVIVKHIPEDSIYEGIYRRRNTTAREDGSDKGETCEDH